MISIGAPTGALGRELSAAWFAEVPAALRARERRRQPIAEREPQLRGERRIVLAPVGEERPNVAAELAEERSDGHIPPPSPL